MRKLLPGPEARADRPRVFYSVGEAAEIFGISDMTLYRAIHEGQFPAVRIRNRLFVPAKAVEGLAAAALGSGALVDAADWLAGEAT
jgi:excisionase family DNA binding protein